MRALLEGLPPAEVPPAPRRLADAAAPLPELSLACASALPTGGAPPRPQVVNDSLFNNVSMGFVDTSPALRELTVKSMVTLAPKLKGGTMQQVMRAFAKLQMDEEQVDHRAGPL